MWKVTEVDAGVYQLANGTSKLTFVHSDQIINCEPICTSHPNQNMLDVRNARDELKRYLKEKRRRAAS